MKNYTLSGIAAIALAILSPVYWGILIFAGTFDSGANFYNSSIEFTADDVLFICLGALSVFVYLGLKRLLNEQLGFSGLNILLNIMIAMCCIYFFGLAGLDAFMSLFGDKFSLSVHKFALSVQAIVGIGGLIVFGLVDIVMGVLIVKNKGHNSTILTIFGIAVIIQGVVELTVIFSPILIVLFPITLLLMAILFLKKPNQLEVI